MRTVANKLGGWVHPFREVDLCYLSACDCKNIMMIRQLCSNSFVVVCCVYTFNVKCSMLIFNDLESLHGAGYSTV
jgi:hypothetical protein